MHGGNASLANTLARLKKVLPHQDYLHREQDVVHVSMDGFGGGEERVHAPSGLSQLRWFDFV